MTTPSINDFPLYTNKPLDDNDWRTLCNLILSYITAGTYDVVFNNIRSNGSITGNTVYTGTTAPTTPFTGQIWIKTDEDPTAQARIYLNATWYLLTVAGEE
jgi:hypothetical protein